jgi:thioredoxin-related protein
MKKSILALLAVALVAMLVVSGFRGSGASPDEWQGTISWQDPAISRTDILESDKPIYVYFHTEWCSFCKKMEGTTFADPKVQDLLNDKFIALEINPELPGKTNFLGEELTFAETATRLGVRGYPASFFFSPEGRLIGGQPGYLAADMFTGLADYVGNGYYRDYSYSEYESLPVDKRK